MGSGGSTLHVVSKLFDREEMFESKCFFRIVVDN